MDPVDDTGFGYTINVVLFLPCEDAAYDNDLFPKDLHKAVDNKLADEGARPTATQNPLRKSDVDTNPIWVHSDVVGEC